MRYLKRAQVFTLVVSQSEILDMDHFFAHIDPEGSPAFFSTLKILDDLVDNMCAGRRVAVSYIPVQDGPVALEDPLSPLGEIFNLIILVHKGHIQRQGIQNAQQFFCREAAGMQPDLAAILLGIIE